MGGATIFVAKARAAVACSRQQRELRGTSVGANLKCRHDQDRSYSCRLSGGFRGTAALEVEPARNPKEEVVSLNYCSQNGGNLYRAPYYNGDPNIGPRIIGNLDESHPIPRKLQSLSLKGPTLAFLSYHVL